MARGIGIRPLAMGLVVAMLLGFVVYFRLWTIDYSITSDETELIRKEFDLAHREAMDESAAWRQMFDRESERAAICEKELREAKGVFENEGSARTAAKLAALQKVMTYTNLLVENAALIKKVEALKKELEVAKLRCKSGEIN